MRRCDFGEIENLEIRLQLLFVASFPWPLLRHTSLRSCIFLRNAKLILHSMYCRHSLRKSRRITFLADYPRSKLAVFFTIKKLCHVATFGAGICTQWKKYSLICILEQRVIIIFGSGNYNDPDLFSHWLRVSRISFSRTKVANSAFSDLSLLVVVSTCILLLYFLIV